MSGRLWYDLIGIIHSGNRIGRSIRSFHSSTLVVPNHLMLRAAACLPLVQSDLPQAIDIEINTIAFRDS
jgi:hypothetical protein